MKKIIIPILIIALILLSFWAYKQRNTPLLISFAILLLIATFVIFFSIDLDAVTGFSIYWIALLANWAGILLLIQRGVRLPWVAVFLFGTFYLVLLRIAGWFEEVKKGAKYIGYLCFLIQLVLSLFLIGINVSFVKYGGGFFFFHSLLMLLFIKSTQEKQDEEKEEPAEDKKKK